MKYIKHLKCVKPTDAALPIWME